MLPALITRSFLLCCFSALASDAAETRPVPDTLDLRANARLSLNFLNGTMDMAQGGVPYFTIYYGANPVALSHKVYDLDEDAGRWLYGLISAREVSGSLQGIDRENILKDYLVSRMVHGDGLVYLPKYSQMCAVSNAGSAWMWGNRSAFMGLLSLYIVHDSAEVRALLDRMVNAIYALALKGDVGRYLTDEYYNYNEPPNRAKPVLLGQNMGGWITPLLKYYQWTGNDKARELATGFAAYIVKHHAADRPHRDPSSFGLAAGDLTGDAKAPVRSEDYVVKISNVHGALFTLGGILRVAEFEHDKEKLAWAKSLVDHVVQHLASSFGWVPEHENNLMLSGATTQSSEACALADLINCCVCLARNGYPEYWNLVERYTRNYLEEAQLKNTDWMPQSARREDTVKESYDNVPARIKGAYVGWGDPNDFVNPTARNPHAIQNCCGPQSVWAVSLVWHNIVTKKPDGVFVNLLLNKRTPWCEVLSYHPYTGRVDVEMYVNSTLHILVPDWADRLRVKVQVNGADAQPSWNGPYARLANRMPGDRIVVTYPLRMTTITDTIKGKGTFHTKWKGNTVVAIDPPGKIAPLFQRDAMLSDNCPMKQERVLETGARVEIPADEIEW